MKTTALSTAVEADSVIVSMTRASMALAEAKTIQQTKKVLDVAAAAEIYARRQKLGEEAEDLAASIKVEALRKLGEMLKAAPKAKGVRAVGGDSRSGGSISAPPETAPTLAELGLTKKESAVAQKLADMPQEQFEQVRDGHVTVAKAIAAVDATKQAKQAPKQTQAEQLREQAAEDAYGDLDPVAALEEALREIEALQGELKAAEADDLKAEAIKWRRMYDNACRQQSDAMDRAHRETKRHEATYKKLTRCGRAVGEEDPDKIPAAVEAFVRQYRKAT